MPTSNLDPSTVAQPQHDAAHLIDIVEGQSLELNTLNEFRDSIDSGLGVLGECLNAIEECLQGIKLEDAAEKPVVENESSLEMEIVSPKSVANGIDDSNANPVLHTPQSIEDSEKSSLDVKEKYSLNVKEKSSVNVKEKSSLDVKEMTEFQDFQFALDNLKRTTTGPLEIQTLLESADKIIRESRLPLSANTITEIAEVAAPAMSSAIISSTVLDAPVLAAQISLQGTREPARFGNAPEVIDVQI
jgi:hypothetical protein